MAMVKNPNRIRACLVECALLIVVLDIGWTMDWLLWSRGGKRLSRVLRD
jgi:hypothetical protein